MREVYAHAGTERSWRRMSAVPEHHSPPYSFATEPLTELELEWWPPNPRHSPVSAPHSARITGVHSYALASCVGTRI